MAKKHGGGHLTEEQLRFLFASGILSRGGHGGKGGRGKVSYNKGRAANVRRMSGKGSASSTFRQKGSTHIGASSSTNFAQRHNHLNNATRSNAYSNGRFVVGGKTAGLRSGGGGEKPKADHSTTRAQRIAVGRNIARARALKAMRGESNHASMEYRLRILESQGTRGMAASEIKRHRGDIGALKGILKRNWVDRIPLPGAAAHQHTMQTRVVAGRNKAQSALDRGVKYGQATITRTASDFGVRGAYNKDAIRDAKREGGQWKDGMWTFGSLKTAHAYSARWYGTNKKKRKP